MRLHLKVVVEYGAYHSLPTARRSITARRAGGPGSLATTPRNRYTCVSRDAEENDYGDQACGHSTAKGVQGARGHLIDVAF